MNRLRVAESMRVYVPLVLAIVLVSAYTQRRNDNFMTFDNWEVMLTQMSVLAVLAIGQTFLIAAGQLDLSVGSFAAFVAVLAATMTRDDSSELVIVIACLAVGVIVGLVWGLIVTLLRVPPFILTLGGLSLFRSLALVRAQDSPVPILDRWSWFRDTEWFGLSMYIVVMVVLLVVSIVVFRYTRFGRHVLALGSSEEAAYLAGLPTVRTKILVFVVNSTLAAIAGMLLMCRIGSGDPNSAGGYELQAIAAVVLGGASLAGGRGSPFGSVLGMLVLQVVTTMLVFINVDDSYNGLVFGGVLIFAVTYTAISDLRRERRTGDSFLASLLRRPPANPGPPVPQGGTQ